MSFATGDVAYQQYLDQILRVRDGLIGITGGSPKLNLETAKYYLKVKSVGALYIGANIMQSKLTDNKTKQYYKDLGQYSDKLHNESGLSTDNTLESSTNPDQLSHDVVSIPVPDNITQLYDDNAKKGADVEKWFRDNNTNEYKNASIPATVGTFPEPGQPVEGHDPNIGEIVSNTTEFLMGQPDGKPPKKIYKGWATVPKGTVNQLGTPQFPMSERLAEMLALQRRTTPGSYRFFIEKLHGKSYDGNFFKKGPVKAGLTPKELPNRMVFPAYVSKFNDSYSMSWDEYNFIGRGEPVGIYKGTSRTLSLEFHIISDYSSELLMAAIDAASKAKNKQNEKVQSSQSNTNKGNTHNINQQVKQNIKDGNLTKLKDMALDVEETLKGVQEVFPDWGDGSTPNAIPNRGQLSGFVPGQLSGTPEMLYERLTFLAQCCYGWYRKDGKLKEQPFVRLRLGDFFDVIARIDSMDFTEDEFDLDLNPSTVGAIPTIVTVAMRLTIVHEDEASSEYRRFYHRRDYDAENKKFVPDSGKATSSFKDGALDGNTSKSPLSFRDSLSDHGKGKFDFPAAAIAQQDGLANFDQSLSNLAAKDSYQKGFELYNKANPLVGFNSSLKDLKVAGQSLNDVAKKERLKNVLKNAKRITEIGALVALEEIPTDKIIQKVVDLAENNGKMKGNLADSPVKDNFNSAQLPKGDGVPDGGKPLFPKFKQPNIRPPGMSNNF